MDLGVPLLCIFQFTPLREGRLIGGVKIYGYLGFQFTPLREGRRGGTQLPGLTRGISIHAPPRGATRGRAWLVAWAKGFQFTPLREGRPACGVQPDVRKISIHAPPRGATGRTEGGNATDARFQFTPLREGRRGGPQLPGLTRRISIHAPPRGATRRAATRKRRDDISIHAPPRGATCGRQGRGARTSHFNSRPSARGDAAARNCPDSRAGFQFTPLREGRRCLFWPLSPADRISIHAPPRGATLNPPPPRAAVPLFQFTPLREGRRADSSAAL